MKRVLLLLLTASLLLMASVPIAAFSDEAMIEVPYAEAVSKMTAKGILNGFPDGSFQPQGTLTREQGAKIVTYMVLGDEVENLVCTAAPFTDVEQDRWSAPCIAWCAEREILLGYGDGRFGPTDLLTGFQFAKMLLCTFELAREGNYVGLGDAWTQAVFEDGTAKGLFAGDSAMASSSPLSREQAALMAWNAMNADAGHAQVKTEPEPAPSSDSAAPVAPPDWTRPQPQNGWEPVNDTPDPVEGPQNPQEPSDPQEPIEIPVEPDPPAPPAPENPDQGTNPAPGTGTDVVITDDGDILLPEVP